jgi:translation elongation factor EF-1alpha
MAEEQVAVVVKFFAKPSVAALEIQAPVKKGDTLRFQGHTTDFTQTVTSMEIDNSPVEKAGPGDLVGLKTNERVRENDKVYRVEE